MANRSPSTRWLRGFTCILLLGLAVEYYAHALGAFILIECPDLSAHAPGHCAHPYWLAIAGADLIWLGAGGALPLALWKIWRAVVR